MALDNTTTFTAAIADWLNRSDLTARIPDFISLAEAKIRRQLKRKTIRNASFAVASEYVALPSDCSELRSIRLKTGTPSVDTVIRIVTPEVLAEHRPSFAGATGVPQWAAVVDGNLLLSPIPGSSYNCEITYFEKFVGLNSTTTNSILTESPDIYLYGVLMEAAPYLEHEERIPVWEKRFDKAILDAQTQLAREEAAGQQHDALLPLALDTYAGLQQSIAGWLKRTDLTAQIPAFITLAEAQIRRNLRRKTIRNASWAVTSEYQALPGDCAEVRSLRLVSSSSYLDTPISLVTPEALAEHRARFQNVPGRPQWASVIDGNLLFVPAPDASYTADITYFEKFASLSTTTTNSVLTESPDIYLYGALAEASPYMGEDVRVALWAERFEKAIADAQSQRDREEYAGSTHPGRLPVVFG